MFVGQIVKLDVAARTAVVAKEDGTQMTVQFSDRAVIEVSEPATTGMMAGTLADLRVGYHVRVEEHEHLTADSCHCHALSSIS